MSLKIIFNSNWSKRMNLIYDGTSGKSLLTTALMLTNLRAEGVVVEATKINRMYSVSDKDILIGCSTSYRDADYTSPYEVAVGEQQHEWADAVMAPMSLHQVIVGYKLAWLATKCLESNSSLTFDTDYLITSELDLNHLKEEIANARSLIGRCMSSFYIEIDNNPVKMNAISVQREYWDIVERLATFNKNTNLLMHEHISTGSVYRLSSQCPKLKVEVTKYADKNNLGVEYSKLGIGDYLGLHVRPAVNTLAN
jgi:hypothetical protein